MHGTSCNAQKGGKRERKLGEKKGPPTAAINYAGPKILQVSYEGEKVANMCC